MKAMSYELFIRAAFGLAKNGTIIEQFEDPARIASAGNFTIENIAKVKAGIGYAMEIFSVAVINHQGISLTDGEMQMLDDFTEKVINAPDLDTISSLIDEFEKDVIDKYFNVSGGQYTLK